MLATLTNLDCSLVWGECVEGIKLVEIDATEWRPEPWFKSWVSWREASLMTVTGEESLKINSSPKLWFDSSRSRRSANLFLAGFIEIKTGNRNTISMISNLRTWKEWEFRMIAVEASIIEQHVGFITSLVLSVHIQFWYRTSTIF